ncbi:EamA family transporter [Treponema sp. Marseille-Q4130]|uniref:EamA family transporter n=1 Tax=Treponema sp. Marseille-Q4130 TaxID=2766702 RepID=UPI002106DDAF|nr:EamA family transporter [Treponema sp. Marseille-Q4130]
MHDMIFYIALLFISVFISACSQIILKKAAGKKYGSVFAEYFNVPVISAYTIYFIAVCIDLIALKKVPVSYIPIVEASSYIFVILLGKLFLKEHLSKRKLIAMSIIFAGVVIYFL